MKNEEIKQYWEQKAKSVKEYIPDITMKDTCLRQLEIESIIRLLKQYKPNDVLDIGCGNGYSTYTFSKYAKKIVGADYSAEMISKCKEHPELSKINNISFKVADVLEISKTINERFDVAITERCLINVPTFENQKVAIKEIHQLLNPGGKYLMIEGIEENFNAMNQSRSAAGLAPIKLDWHNLLFKKAELESFLKEHFNIIDVINFGDYYYISRVFHPLLVAPEEPKFNSKINEIAKSISLLGNKNLEKYSVLELYVLEKK